MGKGHPKVSSSEKQKLFDIRGYPAIVLAGRGGGSRTNRKSGVSFKDGDVHRMRHHRRKEDNSRDSATGDFFRAWTDFIRQVSAAKQWSVAVSLEDDNVASEPCAARHGIPPTIRVT